jgi:hypothetical protein
LATESDQEGLSSTEARTGSSIVPLLTHVSTAGVVVFLDRNRLQL